MDSRFPNSFEEFYKSIHTKPPTNTPLATSSQTTTPEPFLCSKCQFPLILEDNIDCLVCPSCGLIPKHSTVLVEEKDVQEHSSFLLGRYKRLNHFRELLSQLQGTEYIKTFHPEIIYTIKNELVEKEPSKEAIRKILKEKNLKKYFDHIAYIQKRLGYPVLYIPADLELKLIHLFNQFCWFFENEVVTTRHNLLNYNYLIIRFLEFLGEKDRTKCMSQLKQKSKIKAYDEIFNEFIKVIT